jgi:hypothetical protein
MQVLFYFIFDKIPFNKIMQQVTSYLVMYVYFLQRKGHDAGTSHNGIHTSLHT